MKKLQLFLAGPVGLRDVLILIGFTVLITLNPYYLNDRINVFELGLYLPGVNAIEHGLVPYRDFFHLRGPLDLYLVRMLLNIFGDQASVLNACFFFGNVLCLVCVVLIAGEFIRSRYMFYLMIPPIIARTFPRVVYPFWGGFRYVWGLLAVYCFVKFLKSRKLGWMLAVGVFVAGATLTSIEMGVYATAAVIVGLIAIWLGEPKVRRDTAKAFGCFVLAGAVGVAPWVIYSISQQAFLPFLADMWTVVSRMQIVINPHFASIYPCNLPEALAAMLNPYSSNFKQMTPSYTYIFLVGFLIWRWRKGVWGSCEIMLLSLGVYGFIMYNTGFRGLWTAHFEMALMPEKIIYFFLLEFAVLSMWEKRSNLSAQLKKFLYVALVVLFLFSWGYSLARYHNRFWSYKFGVCLVTGKDTQQLKWQNNSEKYQWLALERARGFWVPVDQQEDLMKLERFFAEQTKPQDVVVMFPELGMYNFLFDRPFLGRFPIPTFSWFNDEWFEQYLAALKAGKAKYVVVQKKISEGWSVVYLGYPPNRIKYKRMLDTIDEYYQQVSSTNAAIIYERK